MSKITSALVQVSLYFTILSFALFLYFFIVNANAVSSLSFLGNLFFLILFFSPFVGIIILTLSLVLREVVELKKEGYVPKNIVKKPTIMLLFVFTLLVGGTFLAQLKPTTEEVVVEDQTQVETTHYEMVPSAGTQGRETLYVYTETEETKKRLKGASVFSLQPLDDEKPFSKEGPFNGSRYFTNGESVFLIKDITTGWESPPAYSYSISLVENARPETFSFKELFAKSDPSQSILVFFDTESKQVYFNEYYCEEGCESFAELITVDDLYYEIAAGVQFLGDTDTLLHIRNSYSGGNHLFSGFEGVDLNTLEKLSLCSEGNPAGGWSTSIYKDKNNIYFGRKRNPLADIDTFEYAGNIGLADFSRDKNRVYIGCGSFIDSADTSSFSISYSNELKQTAIMYQNKAYTEAEFWRSFDLKPIPFNED